MAFDTSEDTTTVEYDARGNPVRLSDGTETTELAYDRLERLVSVKRNDRIIAEHTYAAGETDLRIQLDDRTARIRLPEITAPSTFGSMVDIAFVRADGAPLGAVVAKAGFFDLANPLAVITDDEKLLNAISRMKLLMDPGDTEANLKDLNRPSNVLFLPPEFQSINCEMCADQEVSTVFITPGGTQPSPQHVLMESAEEEVGYTAWTQHNCGSGPEYLWFVNDVWQPSFGFFYTHGYTFPGLYKIQVGVRCLCDGSTTKWSSPVYTRIHAPTVKLEQVGSGSVSLVSGQSYYSEDTTIKATVLYPTGHPNAGSVITSYSGQVTFDEQATSYHNGQNGASTLPADISVSSGVATITIKSVSNFNDPSGPPDASISGVVKSVPTNAGANNPLPVAQWRSHLGDTGFIDWLEQGSEDELSRLLAKGDPAAGVAAAVSKVTQTNTGSICGETDAGSTEISIQPVCNENHRLNRLRILDATVTHESRHAWQNAQTNISGNDADMDLCPAIVPTGFEAEDIVDSDDFDGNLPGNCPSRREIDAADFEIHK